jgi:protein tyrosine/serine phosphatase
MTLSNDRTLYWDGCFNIRDLGGLPTEDGAVTRHGAVVRADSIRRLSDSGWKALFDYGVCRIVDLRFESELAADPPRELPVEVVHVSVLPDEDSHHWPEIDAISDAAPDDSSGTRDVYLEFLERFRPRFAQAVEAVADAPEGTVVIHCLGGKDRTGLVTALLLRLTGVPISEIAADYALSAGRLTAWSEAWIAEAASDEERRRRVRISATPAEAMVAVLEELERNHGDVRSYVEIDAKPVAERIRSRLRA